MATGTHPRVLLVLLVVLLAAAAAAAVPLSPTVAQAAPAPGTGQYVLSATSTGGSYAPTFTGNGYVGLRVPPAGQGYAAGSVPTDFTLAGFYAQAPGQVQQRANLPAWSGLAFGDGGQDFSLTAGQVTGWRQQIDLHSGVVSTTATWTAPDGHVTGLSYDVYTDRARPDAAVVRLELTPRWSGTATVTDLIDGTPATLTTGVARGWDTRAGQDWESIRTEGTGLIAALASQVSPPANATDTQVTGTSAQSVGQRFTFGVTAGQSYTVTKYVGIVTAGTSDQATAAARQQATDAATVGFTGTLAENTAAWAALWTGRIDVLGNPTLATEVNASQFYLWSSTRDGSDWSIPPAGLSSNAYNGHIFWDAETWMYPSLLAQHPDLAAGLDAYRYQRLGAAEAHAQATGYAGARYPWESALDGTEQIPPPASVNSEGLYEQHITADVALAQWQYYLATGDRAWLAAYGWPVLSATAAFWASRVTPGPGGSYHINGVTGPDEENPDVNDEVYTNVAAATTLRIAAQAARVVGASAPASWNQIADGLVVLYDPGTKTNPEFVGYQGEMVKQADATMLYYPWGQYYPSGQASAPQADLDYYVPRTDPGGPSMSDAINSVDTSALGSPGCASYVYTQRSVEPFIKDPFDQFSETKTGGAFTFTTGIGGFLQEFLYGYSGLRDQADAVQLDPSLTSQIGGIVLRGLAWHGTRFTVAIGQATTAITVQSGPALPVSVRGSTRTVAPGGTLTVSTRRPDLTSTTDLARCQPATASSAQPGADPLAAVDGSPATGWQPQQVTADLDVPLAHQAVIGRATLDWGQQWPGPPGPNVHPPAGPVQTLRASSYDLVVSENGRDWTVVASVTGRTSGTHDVVTFPPVHARYVGVRITAATSNTPPILEVLTVPAS